MVEITKELKEIIDVEEETNLEVVEKLEKLACKDDTIFLSLIAPYVGKKITPSKEAMASLGLSEEFGVETVIENIKEKTDCKNLILLINSPGSLVQSSYKIARAIRKNFDKIIVFIPHIAASGGTLIALIGNEIVMGMMSQLSPIDPINGGRSALSVVRGFRNITNIFKTMPEEDAPYPLKILAENLEASELDEAFSSLSMVEEHAKEILEMGGIKTADAEKISKSLVQDFLVHEQVINEDTAKRLGLNIINHSKYKEEWQVIRTWLSKYLLTSAGRHIIRYYISKKCKNKEVKEDERKG